MSMMHSSVLTVLLQKSYNSLVKKFITLAIFATLFVLPEHSFAAIRCPTQPKSQKGLNNIFFSFLEPEANLKTHIPKNLVLIDPSYVKGGYPRCLTKQTYSAFVDMSDALFNDTGEILQIASAWRSTQTQILFAKNRPEVAAPPGRSEHQLGTAVDLDIWGSKEEDYFASSKAYTWMLSHAREYGFVQSFTKEGEVLTGIPNEPWHWRFVGKTIATKVFDEKRNLNEFLFERKEAKKKLTP